MQREPALLLLLPEPVLDYSTQPRRGSRTNHCTDWPAQRSADAPSDSATYYCASYLVVLLLVAHGLRIRRGCSLAISKLPLDCVGSWVPVTAWLPS